MLFGDLLKIECIDLSLTHTKKEDVIKALIQKLADCGKISDADSAVKAVIEREEAISTGVGQGVAVPHATLLDLKEPLVAFGRTKNGISFKSIDGKPVHLIFLLLAPEDEISMHLKLLSRVSRLCYNKELRDTLLNAASEKEVLDTIRSYESKHMEL